MSKAFLFIVIPLLFISIRSYSQSDTIWYDNNWKTVNKEKASFFRLPIIKENDKYIISDYYINETIQMTGTSLSLNEEIWDGVVNRYYDNGNIQSIYNYSKGILEGPHKEFLRNGNLKGIVNYSNGIYNGQFVEYYESGQIKRTGDFKNGVKHEDWVAYFEDGSLHYKVSYSLGKREGQLIEYYQNGQIRGNGTYINDKKNGAFEYYFSNGDIISTCEFIDDKINGRLFHNDISRNVIGEGIFKNGNLISYTRKYNKPIRGSNFMMKARIEDNIEHWEIYRDEKLIVTSFFKNTHKIGNWKMYDIDGEKLYRSVNYTDYADCETIIEVESKELSLPIYDLPSYYIDIEKHNINPSSYIVTLEGCLNGLYKEYDVAGNLLYEVNYNNGVSDPESIRRSDNKNAIEIPNPLLTIKE
ncbi:hypothetical protein GCM10011344_10350 [Dokdonia pacifica]|uniref:Antitoxin component YwqK of the YwqJK toxin-antitoxin module n=1 Tax=Dokdonia pacifica TaxID=1627892 RepID=A0A238YMA2_9FLAO|nr:toxin-antitoxin system YwqK family antitoxin [Dokdonia pacifica]GGG11549.1 hypothetical protein GCM10011344_10350 [Dokdonia pacifica]SNR71743.1 Antitoxin component YwqK of the YwqJK toxin-antitoxin module [Dokdonia pacifica]